MNFFRPNKKSYELDQCQQIEKFVKELKKGLKKWQVVQGPHDQLVLFYELEKKGSKEVVKVEPELEVESEVEPELEVEKTSSFSPRKRNDIKF